MKIVLRRVNKTPLDFEVKSDEITFKGYLQYHSGRLVLLKANINGSLIRECDVCAEEFKTSINEEVEFFISDGVYEDDGSITLDVVESLDSMVNIEELLDSEIELIKSDYYSCNSCKNSDN